MESCAGLAACGHSAREVARLDVAVQLALQARLGSDPACQAWGMRVRSVTLVHRQGNFHEGAANAMHRPDRATNGPS